MSCRIHGVNLLALALFPSSFSSSSFLVSNRGKKFYTAGFVMTRSQKRVRVSQRDHRYASSHDESNDRPPKTSKVLKTELKHKHEKNSSDEVARSTDDGAWYNMFTKGDIEYNQYMASEWGIEKRGDVALFEKLSLEGAQSGLSWLTVLRKRDAYRRVFHQFDIDKVAAMTNTDVQAILDEKSEDSRQMVVRHRGKIESVINNAKCIQKMQQEDLPDHKHNAFDTYMWSFVENRPILNAWDGNLKSADTKSPESTAMSSALKKLGFRFVGPTTFYAMMQSVGMVIDHPSSSNEWKQALNYLQQRPGGYQDRRIL
jgi:DNA-3-methyladenine glycosylase I